MLSQQPSTTSHEALALPVVPEEHQALILFYLQRVDKLLHAYARAAHLDYDDLHQDACILIMSILRDKPKEAHTYAYIATSVRSRIIDKIREANHQIVSLDAPIRNRLGSSTIADLIPAGYSLDPLRVLLAKEAVQEYLARLKPVRQRGTRRAQDAIAWLSEVTL